MPTSTIVTTAFLEHARLAARNLHIDELPLVVTPHPLNDLTPDEVRELARAAYPLVIDQLTAQEALARNVNVDFVHPAEGGGRQRASAGSAKEPA